MKSEEFIREVDEELRRDRIAMLWRRYGSVVLAVAVLIVLVQLVQSIGDRLARHLNKRLRHA